MITCSNLSSDLLEVAEWHFVTEVYWLADVLVL
jgi:hypothetical protein